MVDGIQKLVSVLQKTKSRESIDKPKTYSAEVSNIDDEGRIWVYLEGSSIETPTAMTYAEVNVGDFVSVDWRNNKLFISGNTSSPSAGTNRVDVVEYAAIGAQRVATDAQQSAEEATSTAELSQLIASKARNAATDAQENAESAQAIAESAQSDAESANEAVSRELVASSYASVDEEGAIHLFGKNLYGEIVSRLDLSATGIDLSDGIEAKAQMYTDPELGGVFTSDHMVTGAHRIGTFAWVSQSNGHLTLKYMGGDDDE